MGLDNFCLTIPTYRPEKVVRTVLEYDAHFSKFGHEIPIYIFDDSAYNRTAANLSKIASQLQSPVWVIGKEEKKAFLEELASEMACSDSDLATLTKMLRPSFGGNRNHIVLYTFGQKFMAVDDDICPYGLVTPNLNRGIEDENLVIKGNPVSLNRVTPDKKEEDLIGAFLEVLGQPAGAVDGFLRGEYVRDPKAELYKNKSQVLAASESVFHLVPSKEDFSDAKIKMAETCLTGTDNLDSLDFAYFFLNDLSAQSLQDDGHVFVVSVYHPFVTKENWKNACGVSGYDNTEGLPAFFPTALRFENYAYRLWIQKEEYASAHIKAFQHHNRDAHERASLPSEIVNEEFANLLKDKLRASLGSIGPVNLAFDDDGKVTERETEAILSLGRKVYADVEERIRESDPHSGRYRQLIGFPRALRTEFMDFDADAFYQKAQQTIREEFNLIVESQKLWPRCLEAVRKMQAKKGLPLRRITA